MVSVILLYRYSAMHEFILMSLTLMQYHRIHSGLLFLLICNMPHQQWKTWLPLFTMNFFVQPQRAYRTVSELLTHNLMKNKFTQYFFPKVWHGFGWGSPPYVFFVGGCPLPSPSFHFSCLGRRKTDRNAEKGTLKERDKLHGDLTCNIFPHWTWRLWE